MAAARLLQEERPAIILADAAIDWHRGFVSGIPPDRRPAIVVRGDITGWPIACVDEWIAGAMPTDELLRRLELALERARERRRTVRRGYVDPLTGLPNRRALARGLIRLADQARRAEQPLCLALFDLDGFKRVNDLLGHDAGDALLRRVGGALRRVSRRSELLGRLGGDELALVMQGPLVRAERSAQRLCAAIAERGARATAAVCQRHERENLRALYRRTDESLRAQKRSRHATWPSADSRISTSTAPHS